MELKHFFPERNLPHELNDKWETTLEYIKATQE